MANQKQKEPDFYPFRIKDHGWVLKNGTPVEVIGEAFRSIVYQLVSKDFQQGSVAEAMYNDALAMMQANSDKARKAANARWGNVESPPNTPAPNAIPKDGRVSRRPRGPFNKQEFEEFIYDPANNINTALAWEWYDIHSARGWTDKSGAPLTNWKGALINYCKAKGADNA